VPALTRSTRWIAAGGVPQLHDRTLLSIAALVLLATFSPSH
jgi:hypothetical protein